MKERKLKSPTAIVILFALTYMTSYVTRVNFDAIIQTMETSTGLSLALAVSVLSITYGIGQLVSGYFGDRIAPKKLVFLGLLVSTATNLVIPLCSNAYTMTVVWGINGFAQSFMWPPLVKMLSVLLSDKEYNAAVGYVTYGSSLGTILVYLASPSICSNFGWRFVFFGSAAVGAIMLVAWSFLADPVNPKRDETEKQTTLLKDSTKPKTKIFTPIMFFIMFAIVCQGTLRDGVQTWLPSFLRDSYPELGENKAILSGAILPIFSIVCLKLATLLYTKTQLNNPLFCSGIFFGSGALAAALLALLSGKNAAASVAMMAILTGSMHGVNLMFICMIPNAFKSTGKVALVSGVLNSCTYLGSFIGKYVIRSLQKTIGWNSVAYIWFGIALCGAIISFAFAKSWLKKERDISA